MAMSYHHTTTNLQGVQANRTWPGPQLTCPRPRQITERQKNPTGSPTRVLTMSHRCCINEGAASTSGRLAPQTVTGIIFRTRPCRVLTERVRTSGGGGGGRAREAGRGAAFFAFLPEVRGRTRGLTRRFGGCTDRGVPSPFRWRAQRPAACAHRADHPTVACAGTLLASIRARSYPLVGDAGQFGRFPQGKPSLRAAMAARRRRSTAVPPDFCAFLSARRVLLWAALPAPAPVLLP